MKGYTRTEPVVVSLSTLKELVFKLKLTNNKNVHKAVSFMHSFHCRQKSLGFNESIKTIFQHLVGHRKHSSFNWGHLFEQAEIWVIIGCSQGNQWRGNNLFDPISFWCTMLLPCCMRLFFIVLVSLTWMTNITGWKKDNYSDRWVSKVASS